MPSSKKKKNNANNGGRRARGADDGGGEWGPKHTPPVGPDGRRWVALDDGEMRPMDEVVCETFHGPRPSPVAEVEHIDGDRTNNCAYNLRWSVPAARATPTIATGGFVVEPQLTLDAVIGQACAHTQGATIVGLDVERVDTAAESVHKFLRALRQAQTPGETINGMKAPIRNGLVRMQHVGVVVRNAAGGRVQAPPGVPRLPTLYAPVNGDDVFAAFGSEVVARMHVEAA